MVLVSILIFVILAPVSMTCDFWILWGGKLTFLPLWNRAIRATEANMACKQFDYIRSNTILHKKNCHIVYMFVILNTAFLETC